MPFLRTVLIQSRAVARTLPAATRSIHTAPVRTFSPRGAYTPFAVLGASQHITTYSATNSASYDHHIDHSIPAAALYVVSPVQGEEYQVPRGAFSASAPYFTSEANTPIAKPRFRSKISSFAHPLSGRN
ncbi:hypothetical protein E1B28_011532 [Marasmius oreades]|uniref:Uncharacterized protein n=1 Tax=Marasmius oreades TaxID=181124 RepID=A0A9P7UQ29_9AGAR|nr:uncharacterized protein E1B28_011532 [Marasmius oreades]KAG7089898.1 hypothetical protein E1B28_011532 [Marasmius oreades]